MQRLPWAERKLLACASSFRDHCDFVGQCPARDVMTCLYPFLYKAIDIQHLDWQSRNRVVLPTEEPYAVVVVDDWQT